jgi:hypothetical protein
MNLASRPRRIIDLICGEYEHTTAVYQPQAKLAHKRSRIKMPLLSLANNAVIMVVCRSKPFSKERFCQYRIIKDVIAPKRRGEEQDGANRRESTN